MKNPLVNWRKIPLREALRFTKKEVDIFARSNAIRFLPIFFAYGLTILLLLKLAQVILV